MKKYCKFGYENCSIAKKLKKLDKRNPSKLEEELLKACLLICSKCNDERIREKTKENELHKKANRKGRDDLNL